MSGHLFTHLAQPLMTIAALAVFRFDLLSFVTVGVVVMTFTNRLGVFGRVSVV